MNPAHQSVLLTLDVVAGKLIRKDPLQPPPECMQSMVAGATATALAVAMRLRDAQVQVILFQGELLISVLASTASLQALTPSPVNLNDMCVLMSKFSDVPIYFWSGAGWSAHAEGGSLCVQVGTTPTPWVYAEDQVEN
jgi:hypothetical protein